MGQECSGSARLHHQLVHRFAKFIHPCSVSAPGNASPQTWEQSGSTQAGRCMRANEAYPNPA